jgi:hypothetical protein
LNQEHSTTGYFEGLLNDELTRIKALGISIVGMERAGGQLGNHDVLYQVSELAEMILEQESKIREIMGALKKRVLAGEIQIQ